MKVFIFEGNIGSGKTTLIERLEKESDFISFKEEFVDDLEGFYKDPAKKAYDAQVMIYRYLKENEKELRWKERMRVADKAVFDRSPCGAMAFTIVQYLNGHIKPKAFEHLLKTFVQLLDKICSERETFLIYVGEKVGRCLENIKKRGRPMEKDINCEYLLTVERAYLFPIYLMVKKFEVELFKTEKQPEKSKLDSLAEGMREFPRPALCCFEEREEARMMRIAKKLENLDKLIEEERYGEAASYVFFDCYKDVSRLLEFVSGTFYI